MSKHITRIEAFDPENPGRFRVARCSCGWASPSCLGTDDEGSENLARGWERQHHEDLKTWCPCCNGTGRREEAPGG